jgi:hypothetical protein
MQRWNDIGVADELLLPIKLVVAVITFLTYLLTFVLGGVVTVLLLLIYAVVAAEAKIAKRNESQSKANVPSIRLDHITSAALGQLSRHQMSQR